MRAPPDADTMMTGRCLATASSIARVSFSPTAEPMLPPRYANSKAATTTEKPPTRPTPVTTASVVPVFSRAARTRSRYRFVSLKPSGSAGTTAPSRSSNVPWSMSWARRSCAVMRNA